MKLSIKFLIYICSMAFSLVMASCTNDLNITNDSNAVILKLHTGTPTTYGEVTPQPEGVPTFYSGILYLTNEAGLILKYYTIKEEANSETNIRLSEITGTTGKLIEGLPHTTRKIYVIGNTQDLATSGNIINIKNTLLSIDSQKDIDDLSLYGEDILILQDENLYTCTINLQSTVSRIEIPDISCTGDIIGFSLDGIFIDNYYNKATIDGSVSLEHFKSHGESTHKFIFNSTEYPSALNGIIYDWYNTGFTSSYKRVKPDNNKVWAYNLFANKTCIQAPNIIIRLSNIITASGISYHILTLSLSQFRDIVRLKIMLLIK